MSLDRVLLTGATGFLGVQIQKYFSKEVIGLGKSQNNDIRCDLAQNIPSLPALDIVIHNAGKAHSLPKTAAEREAFFQVNYQGTLNLLTALDNAPCLPQQIIFISTVAVYGVSAGEFITENQPLEGITPYAKSKILAEQALSDWSSKNGIKCLILRLPLVVGSNAPGNLAAIHNSIREGWYIRVKGNSARKSVVLGDDVGRLIANSSGKTGIFNLTDGIHPTFEALENAIADSLNKKILFSVPKWPIEIAAKVGDGLNKLGIPFPLHSARLQKMTSHLTFSSEKAVRELGWKPKAVIPAIRNGILN